MIITVAKTRELHRASQYDELIENLAPVMGELQPEQSLLLGLALVMTGKPDEGSEVWRLVLDTEPDNSQWVSDRALLDLLRGQYQSARDRLLPNLLAGDAEAIDYARMGAAQLALSEVETAEQHYREAVEREPGHPIWHTNLAAVLLRQQKLELALPEYEKILQIEPDNELALAGRDNLLMALDKTEELVEEYEQKLEELPEDVSLRIKLARSYVLDERLSDAIKTLREGMIPPDEVPERIEEDCPDNQVNQDQIHLRLLLAEILAEHGNHGRSLRFLRQVLKLDPPEVIPIRSAEVRALIEIGQFDEAREILEELDAEDAPGLNQVRVLFLSETGAHQEAEELLRSLLETYPGNTQLMASLGQSLLWLGKLDEAAEWFEKASETNPMALAEIVKTRNYPTDPAVIKKMEEIAENKMMRHEPRATMAFALAEVHDKNKDYEHAFHFLDMANQFASRGLNYSPGEFSNKVSKVINFFDPAYFQSLPAIRAGDRTPVFVVGMPRSGTTLTEQILCSHKDVFGAGELDLLPVLTRLISKVIKTRVQFPGSMEGMTPELREEAARYYLYGMMQHDEEHAFVVDKMPHNFVNLGLIASVLPAAKIIHIQRDPRDTAISNFQQNFKAKRGGLGYAFDLEHTACQLNDYHRLMAHWREVLPVPMFEVTYEELVEDQETVTREMLDFIGIDWDDNVTNFHQTERAVRTASVSQVRQPIYKTSRRKWKNYEAFIAPLLDNLNDEVVAKWQ